MKNIEEVRTNLSKLYDDLTSGNVEPKKAKELANVTGKIISSAKVQVDYYLMRKQSARIPFLESSDQTDNRSGRSALPVRKPTPTKAATKKAA